MELNLKSRICVFCTGTTIVDDEDPGGDLNNHDDDEEPTEYLSSSVIQKEDTFSQGVSVLCETLNVDQKYAELDEWRLLGIDNFVSCVCCRKCYLLLANLVSLHQLVLRTQVSLRENTKKLQDLILLSHKNDDDDQVEYSVNACVRFREEILKNFTTRCTRGDAPTSRRTRKAVKVSPSINVKTVKKLPIPFVMLERLNLSTLGQQNIAQEKRELDNLEDRYQEDDDHILPSPIMSPSWPPPNLCPSNDGIKRHKKAKMDRDTDYNPTTFYSRRRRRGTGRKAGRPRKHPTTPIPKIPRKRGRPPKQRVEEELQGGNNGEEGTAIVHKGRRRRRNKFRRMFMLEISEENDGHFGDSDNIPVKNEDKQDLGEEDMDNPPGTGKNSVENREDNDEDYQPSDQEPDNDEEKIANKRTKVRSNKQKVKKIPGVNGRFSLTVGGRRYICIHEGPKHNAVHLLNSADGMLMVYYVKFQKSPDYLQCLHPDCNYREPHSGYFADQTTFRNFRFHVRYHHRNAIKSAEKDGEEASKNYFYCHHCEAQLDSKVNLLEHRRQEHPEGEMPPLFCEVCGDSGPQSELVNHIISHKSEEEKKLIFENRYRGVGKDKDITLPLHYPCDKCDKCFKCHTELRIHLMTHIPVEIRKQFICDVCGEKQVTAAAVEHHKRRVHLRDLPVAFECHVCSKKFLRCQKDRYEAHLRLHTGEKPFKCRECGKAFHAKTHLSRHESLHKDISVVCEFCSQVYKNRRYLRKHQFASHPDLVERPIKDPEERERNKPLERREDFIGPKLLFPCEPCRKVFIFKSILVTHLKNRHKIELPNKEDYPWQYTWEDSEQQRYAVAGSGKNEANYFE